MSTSARDPRLEVDAEGLGGLWTRFTRRVREGELGSLPVVIGLIIIWLYFSITEENFLTSGNITNLMLQITTIGIDRDGCGPRPAARRDRPVGRRRQRTGGGKHGGSEHQARWSGWASIAAAIGVGILVGAFQGGFVTFLRVPSFVVTLAGLLGFQGLLLYVLGDTGTINMTDSTIIDLADTFYSDYVGWIIAVVLLVPYVLLSLNGHRRRLSSGLETQPLILLIMRLAVVVVGVIVAVAVPNADRAACRWRP